MYPSVFWVACSHGFGHSNELAKSDTNMYTTYSCLLTQSTWYLIEYTIFLQRAFKVEWKNHLQVWSTKIVWVSHGRWTKRRTAAIEIADWKRTREQLGLQLENPNPVAVFVPKASRNDLNSNIHFYKPVPIDVWVKNVDPIIRTSLSNIAGITVDQLLTEEKL